MSAHGLRLTRMASSSQVLNADLDASDEAGCGTQCEIAQESMGSNPKPSEQHEQEQQEQQEQQQHHPKHFTCPHEKSSCALFGEEEEEEEEEENERPDCNSCGRAHAFWLLLDLQPNLLIVRER